VREGVGGKNRGEGVQSEVYFFRQYLMASGGGGRTRKKERGGAHDSASDGARVIREEEKKIGGGRERGEGEDAAVVHSSLKSHFYSLCTGRRGRGERVGGGEKRGGEESGDELSFTRPSLLMQRRGMGP